MVAFGGGCCCLWEAGDGVIVVIEVKIFRQMSATQQRNAISTLKADMSISILSNLS